MKVDTHRFGECWPFKGLAGSPASLASYLRIKRYRIIVYKSSRTGNNMGNV